MNLYFQNSHGQERLIAQHVNVKECYREINKFLDDHSFKSYYTRMFEEDGRIIFDVGSHTEFFIVDGANMNDFR